MSWSCSCIFVNLDGDGYFGTTPVNDEAKGTQILAQLYSGFNTNFLRSSSLLDELTTKKSHVAVGAYEHGFILCDTAGMEPEFKFPGVLIEQIHRLYPRSIVLSLELAGVCNYFCYAIYENGELIRAYGGSPFDGIVVDHGDPVAEEIDYFENSEVIDGERVFRYTTYGVETQTTATVFGETLAMNVARKMLGKPLDDAPLEELDVCLYAIRTKARKHWDKWIVNILRFVGVS